MTRTAFGSRSLPAAVARPLAERVHDAHLREPFDALDPRGCIRRVGRMLDELGVHAVVYRGGLDLRGSELDHIWLAVAGRVVDVAFPLFVDEFVATLRRYVAGDVAPEDLVTIAAAAGADARVLGRFPSPLRYCGAPVWSSRHGA